jgi:Domain of Unknown Function (DUF928)
MTEQRIRRAPPGLRSLALAALLLPALLLVAPGGPAPGQQAAASTAVVYVPPDLGAPPTRTLAATRGLGGAATAQVLAPAQTGLTQAAQPTLFWYLGGPAVARVELTLIDQQKIEPLLQLDLGAVQTPGIHAVSLAAHGIRLEPGRLYQWSIAQVVDPARPSADIVTSATLQRRAPDAALAQALAGASPTGRLAALARHGYWYDLQAELEAQIRARPDAAGWRALRADLLAQVGLDEIAEQAASAPVVQ